MENDFILKKNNDDFDKIKENDNLKKKRIRIKKNRINLKIIINFIKNRIFYENK